MPAYLAGDKSMSSARCRLVWALQEPMFPASFPCARGGCGLLYPQHCIWRGANRQKKCLPDGKLGNHLLAKASESPIVNVPNAMFTSANRLGDFPK